MGTNTSTDSLFRLSGPSQADIESFHNDGYIAYPDVFTDDGREGLIEEITQHFEPTRQYIEALHNGEAQERPLISFVHGMTVVNTVINLSTTRSLRH